MSLFFRKKQDITVSKIARLLMLKQVIYTVQWHLCF